VNPEILTAASDHYVRALADVAAPLREYLLRHGVTCAPMEQRWGLFRTFRLDKTADLQLVRSLLDRWVKERQASIPVH
jgi:hypothetical protein